MAKIERYYCDVCKLEIDKRNIPAFTGHLKQPKRKLKLTEKIGRGSYDYIDTHFDICAFCAKTLTKMIRNKRKVHIQP